mgnify:CR=1 FL=1
MMLSGMVRLDMYYKVFSASQNGVEGNVKGEGRLLGGTLF